MISGGNIAIGGGSINTDGGTLLLTPGAAGSVSPTNSGQDISASATSFTSGSTLTIGIAGTTADTQYTQLNLAGSVDLTDVNLNLNVSVGTVVAGDSFTIVSIAGTDPLARTETFNNLPSSGSFITVGGLNYVVDYAGGDGNDVTLTASALGVNVTGTVPNGGVAYINNTFAPQQHSMVESVVYSFSSAVSLSAMNFSIIGLPGSGTSIVPTLNVSSSLGNTVWTVTFAGAGVNTGTHSIGDGEYGLALNVPGLSNTYDFFRLQGDMDGDGMVNMADFSTMVGAFLRAANDPLYLGRRRSRRRRHASGIGDASRCLSATTCNSRSRRAAVDLKRCTVLNDRRNPGPHSGRSPSTRQGALPRGRSVAVDVVPLAAPPRGNCGTTFATPNAASRNDGNENLATDETQMKHG